MSLSLGDTSELRVVCNGDRRYSIWPAAKSVPRGWAETSVVGGEDECRAFIDREERDPSSSSDFCGTLQRRFLPSRSEPACDSLSAAFGPARALAEEPVHAVIARSLRQTPNREILRDRDDTLTGGELLSLMRRLSHVFRGRGVERDSVVAVLLPKGCAAVAVMLGILEAGGAYLVLSNTDPADRLFEILVDARYPLLVTDERSGRVPPAYAGDVVTVQWLMREAEQVGDAPLNASVTLDDRAYILYTSGTTGRPKGVEHTHLQLVNYATWAGEAYPLHEHESVALHASLAFAGCISSLFPALAHGWAIDAAPEAIHVSELAHYYAGVNLGFLKLTPSLARVLSLSQEYMLTARQIMVSSEAFIAAEWVRRWLLQHSEIRFLHHYGLSETCGGTCGPIRHDDLVAGEAVPCGRPIFNSGVFVVRPDLTLAPRGEVGEVYLGGAVLGRGYFNEPGRTALRWLPCPWGGAPGSVMLWTGDLGRLDCENRLAILGRADRQMKIRGVRVEPADVEAKLCSDGNIVDAVVVGKAARGGALSLVAYVVAKDATTFDARAVRKSLEGQVSRAAVPSKIVCVSELPLTPHGKLDIRKLQSEPDRDATQETGSVLRTLLASLSEIADVPPQAEDMSFIDVGGDSLAAVAFAVALTESLGIEVTPADLIDLRPLRALAEDLASRATRS